MINNVNKFVQPLPIPYLYIPNTHKHSITLPLIHCTNKMRLPRLPQTGNVIQIKKTNGLLFDEDTTGIIVNTSWGTNHTAVMTLLCNGELKEILISIQGYFMYYNDNRSSDYSTDWRLL